ncbi:hypothetical protein E4T56_gene5653 [Termitomyces sp. T112]|nr:hypothetical protein E4T56_gene5653 [Termitomyces sp. T112]
MNATIESLFGPPSEPIDIPAFIQAATAASIDEDNTEELLTVADECDISDIRDDLSNTWNNPRLSAYLSTNHDQLLIALNSTTKAARNKRKVPPQDSLDLPPDVVALQNHLGAVKLSCWKLSSDSSTFIRHSKISDQNVLTQVKIAPEPSAQLSEDKNAIVTITVHIRSTWTPGYINRSSQHALLSSQTLGDLFRIIPCISNEIIAHDGQLGNAQEPRQSKGCVVCIGNIIYGDGHCEEDYAQKLLNHLGSISKDKPVLTKASTTIFETPLSSLKLQVNQPYWLLHKGNCEHFLVVDQIRLQHTSDLSSGYPLTLQITPALLDLCRACAKVPAALSIIGDIRLGEIRQLPKYVLGW